jgi:hypothetical protein
MEGALRIMTPDFELRGEIPIYASLQLTRRHYGVGEFELHLHPNTPNSGALEHDSILFLANEPHKAGIIETVALKEGAGDLMVTGYTLKGLTKRRVAVPPLVGSNFGWDRVTADAESVLQHYVASNMTAPEAAGRVMPRMTLVPNQHRGVASLPWQARFEQLDEVLQAIGEYADLGWTITPDFGAQTFVFDVVPGQDLHESNPGTKRVTISVLSGNASEASYTDNRTAWRNVAYTGGAGEDEERLIQAVGNATGLQRREMWVDAGSIDNAPEIITMGQRKLTESSIKKSISATVLDSGAFLYGRDWDLGDKVTVRAGNAQMDARVTEVREVLEQGRTRQVSVVFGAAPISLAGVLRGNKTIAR